MYIFIFILLIGSSGLIIGIARNDSEDKSKENIVSTIPSNSDNNTTITSSIELVNCNHSFIYGQTNPDFYLGKVLNYDIKIDVDIIKMVSWFKKYDYILDKWKPSGANVIYSTDLVCFTGVGSNSLGTDEKLHTIKLGITYTTNSMYLSLYDRYKYIFEEYLLVECDDDRIPFECLDDINLEYVSFDLSDLKLLLDSGVRGMDISYYAPYIIQGNFVVPYMLYYNVEPESVDILNSIDFIKVYN